MHRHRKVASKQWKTSGISLFRLNFSPWCCCSVFCSWWWLILNIVFIPIILFHEECTAKGTTRNIHSLAHSCSIFRSFRSVKCYFVRKNNFKFRFHLHWVLLDFYRFTTFELVYACTREKLMSIRVFVSVPSILYRINCYCKTAFFCCSISSLCFVYLHSIS